jgi:hypothetical protein
MNTKEIIKSHKQAIEILEAIAYFERIRKNTEESLNGFIGTFSDLRVKYNYKLEIYSMCINRLYERYVKLWQTKL